MIKKTKMLLFKCLNSSGSGNGTKSKGKLRRLWKSQLDEHHCLEDMLGSKDDSEAQLIII